MWSRSSSLQCGTKRKLELSRSILNLEVRIVKRNDGEKLVGTCTTGETLYITSA